eukprot:gene9881-biopygen7688
MPVYTRASWCVACDGVMDVYGDHALVCCGGGDRTVRHNQLRNAVYHMAASAGLRPELEKPGLLRPRPELGSLDEDGSRTAGQRTAAGRRPADVFLPSFQLGCRTCLDFACTSGMRAGFTYISALDGSAAVSGYEMRKRSFLDTETQCKEE